MTNRGGGRPSQVRPRPPSTGRPAPVRVRPRAPSYSRLGPHRKVERGAGISLGARLALAIGVLALGGAVLYTATGGLGRIAATLATTVGGFVGSLTATPTPSPTVPLVLDPPVIESPDEPYTNQPAVDLVVVVPTDVAKDPATRVRLYVSLGGKAPKRLAEVTMGTTPRVVIPSVKLTAGANDFTATVFGAAGESEPSSVVTYILDQAKPPVTLTSPKNNATINKPTVTITGKTQGRSTVIARNDGTGTSGTALASADGAFSVTLALAPGTNAIAIAATDPAGNVGTAALTVRRGTGKLTADLSASAYKFSRAKLPDPLTLTVLVTDPDGKPLAGARATFSLTISGVAPITADRTTGADGRANFRTTVPKGASVGQGVALVLVSAKDLGTASAQTVITITK